MPVDIALFTPQQVAVASFFGGPIGGCGLIALNEARLERRNGAWLALLLGVAFTALAILLAFKINLPKVVLPVAYTVGLQQFAMFRYGKEVAKRRSNWTVFGIAVAGLAVSIGAVFGIAYAQWAAYDRVTVNGIEVIYRDSTTKEQATAVAETLGAINPAGGWTIVIGKHGDAYTVGLVMRDMAFGNPAMQQEIAGLAQPLSGAAFGGAQVEMSMLDDGLEKRWP